MQHDGYRLEVICGSMFSGKSEELIRRVRRARFARQKVQVFKPAADQRPTLLPFFQQTLPGLTERERHELAIRQAAKTVASHDGIFWDAFNVRQPHEIMDLLDPDTEVVAIDEVQFLGSGVIPVCEALANRGLRVIVAGLDQDFRGEPFVPMPELMARAESVQKLQAICVVCGSPASRSQRLINGQPARWDDPIVLLGASEVYEARCRRCHTVPAPAAPANAEF